MSQPISVNVQMDVSSFHDFALFDLLYHRHAWRRPAIFAAILLVSAGICLTQVGVTPGAGLLTATLAIIAVGLPAVYFWTYLRGLKKQIKSMGLPRPFYRLELDDKGFSVWMAGEQDKSEPTRQYSWHDMYIVYRTSGAIYLYVQQHQAYLLNDSTDAAWSLLQSVLPAERLRDMRRK